VLDPLSLSINEAWKYQGLTLPNPAVGACVSDANGAILSVEAHKKASEPHAEVLALLSAYNLLNQTQIRLDSSEQIHNFLLANHNGIFNSLTITTTLEPCSHVGKTPSCADLLCRLQIKRVVVGCSDEHKIARGGADLLTRANIEVEILDDVRCMELIEPFLLSRKRAFVLFKWAQRLDGTIDGGTISSLKSREFVHQIRSTADLLVIGAQSVRDDRPILDARLVNGRAPDVLILSHTKKIDRSIPLFSVKDRDVYISDNLDLLEQYRYVLVEGGARAYESIRDRVDMHLCFISPSTGGTIRLQNIKRKILHQNASGDDIKIWMR